MTFYSAAGFTALDGSFDARSFLVIMNVNNNAIKRIMADVRELAKHPSPRYSAAPLEDNIFEWHFSIRGPSGTDFEGYSTPPNVTEVHINDSLVVS